MTAGASASPLVTTLKNTTSPEKGEILSRPFRPWTLFCATLPGATCFASLSTCFWLSYYAGFGTVAQIACDF